MTVSINHFFETCFSKMAFSQNISFSQKYVFPNKFFSVTGATCEIRKIRVFWLPPYLSQKVRDLRTSPRSSTYWRLETRPVVWVISTPANKFTSKHIFKKWHFFKNNLQMIITPPSVGLRTSSWAHPIQVDHAGAHGTGPDRFRAVPDHFLMKTQIFSKMVLFQNIISFVKKVVSNKKCARHFRARAGPGPRPGP